MKYIHVNHIDNTYTETNDNETKIYFIDKSKGKVEKGAVKVEN